jgi:hypothetical protein
MAEAPTHHALGDRAAFQLANVTKTPPQYSAITPRWLVRLLDWKPLEAGTFRVNRVVNEEAVEVSCGTKDEKTLPDTFVDHEEKPREYTLCLLVWPTSNATSTRFCNTRLNPSGAFPDFTWLGHQEQGWRGLFRAGWLPNRRRRGCTQSRRNRRAFRTSLCTTDPSAIRAGGQRAGIACALQHLRRNRRTCCRDMEPQARACPWVALICRCQMMFSLHQQLHEALEAREGIEPSIKVLQTFALPLGDRAVLKNATC